MRFTGVLWMKSLLFLLINFVALKSKESTVSKEFSIKITTEINWKAFLLNKINWKEGFLTYVCHKALK